jgi:hypothetical protein
MTGSRALEAVKLTPAKLGHLNLARTGHYRLAATSFLRIIIVMLNLLWCITMAGREDLRHCLDCSAPALAGAASSFGGGAPAKSSCGVADRSRRHACRSKGGDTKFHVGEISTLMPGMLAEEYLAQERRSPLSRIVIFHGASLAGSLAV